MQKTILVIDDDEVLREVMQILLTEKGRYDVLLAESGMVALDHLRSGKWKPDLILVDERMPIMMGDAFVRQLEQEGLRTMPIVLFSASNTISSICAKIKADGCLCKPFELSNLFGLIKNLLGVTPL